MRGAKRQESVGGWDGSKAKVDGKRVGVLGGSTDQLVMVFHFFIMFNYLFYFKY
jgi:hypothetical protein